MLDRLHGPAVLYIASKTAAEIALSMMAEVVTVKNGVQRPASLPLAAGKAWLVLLARETAVSLGDLRGRETSRIEWGIVGRQPIESKQCLCCVPWSR